MPTASGLWNDRGSVLVIALVLIFAMTILGLALFDLAQIEGQLASTSQADARALYIAQAGLERGIRELRNGFLADAYASASWADAVNGPTCTPVACDATQYRLMNIANTTVPATGTDPGGTYVVEMKLVLVAEANNPISQGAAFTYPYGQECIPDTGTPTVCANLVFLRTTGTVNGPPGFTATAMIQTLVKATPTSPFAAALTAAGTTGAPNPAIDGRVRVAGTVQALGTGTSNPVVDFRGGAADGMRNNYQTLAGTYELDRIRRRQLVCPPQTNCTGGANLVESVGAELRVYGNVTATQVRLANNTDAGQNANTAAYGQAGNTRVGKGRLDGVYVAGGCPLPCTSSAFTFGTGANVWVDYGNYTKPYPDRPPKLPLWYVAGNNYPVLNNPTSINGAAYASYSTDFIVARAAQLDNQRVNGGVCPNNTALTLWECSAGLNPADPIPANRPPSLGTLFAQVNGFSGDGTNCGASGGSFTNCSPPFRHSFTFTDKTGVVRSAEICWKRTTMTNNTANRDAGVSGPNLPSQGVAAQRPLTFELGIPDCTAPNPPSNPILIYFPSAIWISRQGGPGIYTYRGSAIVMQDNHSLNFEESWISYCTVSTAAPGTECAAGQRFAEDHLMVFLTFGLVNIGMVNNNVNTVMAYVWTDQFLSSQRDTRIIGSLRANHLCFQSASAAPCSTPGGGPDPSVYQATAWDLRRIPEELPGGGASGDRWRIDSVPRFWMVCRPGAVPNTPTANCGYQ